VTDEIRTVSQVVSKKSTNQIIFFCLLPRMRKLSPDLSLLRLRLTWLNVNQLILSEFSDQFDIELLSALSLSEFHSLVINQFF